MSTFKHPVGPESGGTYWRRRIMFLFVVLAVVAVVVLIVVRPGSGDAEEPPTSTGDSSTTPPPSAPAKAEGEPCDPSALVVTAITDSTSYAEGEKPKLALAVTNTGEVSCTIDGGTASQVFTITSGKDVYWQSTDCQKDPASQEVLLAAGSTVKTEAITWDRTRSNPDTCDSDDRPKVPAGGAAYHLSVEIAGVKSTDTRQFLLN